MNDNGYTKNNEPFDLSIHATNHVLFLPLTTKKFDDDNAHPALTPIDDILDCCASYIKDESEDRDLKFDEVNPEIKKLIKQPTNDDCSGINEGDENNLYSKKIKWN